MSREWDTRMPDDTEMLMQHLSTMQEALSDHNTYVVGQVTAARQALEACLEQLTTRVAALEDGMTALVPLLNRMVEYIEKQPKPEPKPKVASYADLYPELRSSPVAGEAPIPAGNDARVEGRSSPWCRLFSRKVPA